VKISIKRIDISLNPRNLRKKPMKKFIQSHPIEILFSILFLTLAAILNLQFLEGANVNFTFSGHDEYLTVREVYSIIEPLSFKHFIMAIISGDVLYYGRIVFYIDAIFAYIPYKIWGIEGMVYAIRMTHVIELLLGVLLLSRFIKSNTGKVFFIFNVLILYYTAYFVMVPKPEPLQLLFLAIFIIKAHKVNWQFGWHFVWLGLAYGAKFNVLTVLPLFFILPYLKGYKKIVGLIKSGFAFVVGITIAIPSLILAPIKPIFLKTYLDNTFGKAEHYDDAGVSFATWVKTGWLGAFSGSFWIGLALVVIVVWVVLVGTKNYFEQKQINTFFIFTLIGIGFLLPVMLFTERLWPHYLWTSHIFLLLGAGMFVKSQLKFERVKYALMFLITFGGCWSITAQGKHLFSLEKQSKSLLENSTLAYSYTQTQKDSFIAVQDITVFYPFEKALKANLYHPFEVKKPGKEEKMQYHWSGFINPQILMDFNADFLIVNKSDFENLKINTDSQKEIAIIKNNALMRNELGKSIFLDTAFGTLKVYRIKFNN
jgi:hypothetical protein